MSGPYRAVQRAIRLVILSAALAFGTSFGLWALLGNAGIRMPFPTVLAGIGLVVAWSVVSSLGGGRQVPPPAPPAGPPRRRPTWEDAERMASLHRQGLLAKDDLDRVLRELIPPKPAAPPPGRRTDRR
jgi:hypothetical protein